MSRAGGPRLGLGIGWRAEIAAAIEQRSDLGFVELMAEDFDHGARLPASLERLRERGLALVPHGVSLSLGSAEPPDRRRLDTLARLAERVGAPLVSEHVAFVRGGGLETGHLLPMARTRQMLDVLVANVRMARETLPVPLALENIATLFEWPEPEMDEAVFLNEVVERSGALLLLDVENVYANAHNHRFDAIDFLDRLPLDRIAYVHVAGGVERDGWYHDTHACEVPAAVLELLTQLCARTEVHGVMLERDDRFAPTPLLYAELDAIAGAIARGDSHRRAPGGSAVDRG